MLGGVAFPPVLGAGIQWAGTGALPLLLFAVNGLCLVVVWRIARAARHGGSTAVQDGDIPRGARAASHT